MDGKLVGDDKIQVGRILYFDAPIPIDALRFNVQKAVDRYERQLEEDELMDEPWRVNLRFAKRLSKDGDHIYTLILFENNDDYLAFLPREKTERVFREKILSLEDQDRVNDLKECIQLANNAEDYWEAARFEDDLERLLTEETFLSFCTAACPLSNLSFDDLTKRELSNIRNVRAELVDDTNRQVLIKPSTCYYYKPGQKYSSSAITGKCNFRPDPNVLKQDFRLCASADNENYPKVTIQKAGTKWKVVINFAPYSSDAITAVAFWRDYEYLNKGYIRFTYLYMNK